MPVDIIVGYLATALAGGGKRWADRRLDSLLDHLTRLVADRMGRGSLDQLARRPRDKRVRRELGETIDEALAADREFARELKKVIAELDSRGGRTYIELGPDYSRDRLWIKLFVALGTVLTIVGAAIFGYAWVTFNPNANSPGFGQIPPEVVIAGVVFFVGSVLLTFASLGHSLSGR